MIFFAALVVAAEAKYREPARLPLAESRASRAIGSSEQGACSLSIDQPLLRVERIIATVLPCEAGLLRLSLDDPASFCRVGVSVVRVNEMPPDIRIQTRHLRRWRSGVFTPGLDLDHWIFRILQRKICPRLSEFAKDVARQ